MELPPHKNVNFTIIIFTPCSYGRPRWCGAKRHYYYTRAFGSNRVQSFLPCGVPVDHVCVLTAESPAEVLTHRSEWVDFVVRFLAVIFCLNYLIRTPIVWFHFQKINKTEHAILYISFNRTDGRVLAIIAL